jgi:hypothetical protein
MAIPEYEYYKVRLFVATPCFGGLLHLNFFNSILDLLQVARQVNMYVQIKTIGGDALITRARNALVAQFLGDKAEYTHLLWIDADMSFSPITVLRMIASNKDVVAGCCPKKGINWTKVFNIIKDGSVTSPEFLEQKALDYVVNIVAEDKSTVTESSAGHTAQIVNGFIRVENAGTGFMMIKRNVFIKMKESYPELIYVNDVAGYNSPDTQGQFYGFFDCMYHPSSRRYLSEDYAFCLRWAKIGGDIWADVTAPFGHVGSYQFNGGFLKIIESLIKTEPQAVAAAPAAPALITSMPPTETPSAPREAARSEALPIVKDTP